MAIVTFENVWFRPGVNRWRDLNLGAVGTAVAQGANSSAWRDPSILAYTDVGKLSIQSNSLEFVGGKESLTITSIRSVTYGKQGRDFINNWVRIEFGDAENPSCAYFADGSRRGWGGIFGGSKRIFKAVKILISE